MENEQQTLQEALEAPKTTEPEVHESNEPKAQEVSPEKETHQVPLPELLNERRARQALEGEVEEWKTKFGTLEERLEMISEKIEPTPDMDEDPFGAMDTKLENTNKSIAELKQDLQKSSEQTQAQAAQAQLAQMESTFAQANPDYHQAMEYLRDKQIKQWEALGHSSDEAMNKFLSDTRDVIQAASRNNKNPAQVAYEWAKENGFSVGNGKANEQKPAQKKSGLNAVAEGLKNEGLASSGGAAPSDIPSAEELASMPTDEWNEWYDKLGDKGFKKIMEG